MRPPADQLDTPTRTGSGAGRGRVALRWVAVGAVATLVLGGASRVDASEPPPDSAGDVVASALGRPASIDDIDDIDRLSDATDDLAGTRLVVVSEGSDPGAQPAVDVVVADAAQVDELTRRISSVDGVRSVRPDTRVSIASNDTYSSSQYSGPRIRADRLPATATGDGVLVAIIDTGVDATHADLSPALPGGRTRVLRGTSFLSPTTQGGANRTGTRGDVDLARHGTHVAGIVAAARDNGIGIAGAAPDAQILPIRVLDERGVGWASDTAAAVLWAHDQGADVINLSLAGPSQDAALSSAIDHVTTDTTRGKAPSIVVAAAGNQGSSSPTMWPAAHARAIAVASSDASDRVASNSSRGSWVDVTAPGVGIISTCGSGSGAVNSYCSMSGTSMASPLVAAAAAILRQQSPGRTPSAVSTLLRNSTHDIDAAGVDRSSGAGRIDLATAYDPTRWPRVPRPVSLPAGRTTRVLVQGSTILVEGTIHDPDGPPIVRVDTSGTGAPARRERAAAAGRFQLSWTAARGTHKVCVTALDNPTARGVAFGCTDAVVK